MNCKQANKIPIKTVLKSFSFFPSKKSKRGAFYFAVDRKERTPSLHVDFRKNTAHDFGTGKNYGNVSLVQTIKGCSVSKALEYLTNLSSFSFHNPKEIALERKNKDWMVTRIIPVTHPALISYLQRRNVKRQRNKVREIHYTNNGKPYFGIGFQNDSGGWEVRNKYAKICLGKKDVTSVRNGTRTLRIFEGFFDYLSFLCIRESLEMEKSDYLILNSISMVRKLQNELTEYEEIELYLDNDSAGNRATETLKKASVNATDNRILYPNSKDLNEFINQKCIR